MNQVIINNKKYKLEKKQEEMLIYQFCNLKGIEIPCFCYNENLEIAGNCRICLVEIKKMPKLMLTCATKIEKNMVISTLTKRLKKVRQSVVEFLLINHPLDCPICDQGGECDLQNITELYGLDRGRFYEFAKRSVLDKDSGFFIKTIMTRCIHCTRCVRFFKEIEGISGFSLVNRGENSEIVAKKENLLSILSGNVVDLCPVGALTSKNYAFVARPWELNKYENIDILDSMCSTISLNLRNNKVLRVLPAGDNLLNNDWITNITRYFFDILHVQRLLKPFLVLKKSFLDLSWYYIVKLIINKIIFYIKKDKGFNFFLYDFIDLESFFFLKKLNINLGFLNINLSKNLYNNCDWNFFFFFNTSLQNLKDYSKIFFLLINLRLQMPLLNTNLRLKLKKKKNVKIFSLGFVSYDISYDIVNIGNNFLTFFSILENKSKLNFFFFFKDYLFSSFNVKFFKKDLQNERDTILTKDHAFLIGDNFFFFKNTFKLILDFCSKFFLWIKDLFVLFTNTIDLNYQNLNLKTRKKKKMSLIYSFFNFSNSFLKKKKGDFSILQSSIFFKNFKNYNIILPVTSFFEYTGFFFNFEGRLRKKLKVYSYKNSNLKSNKEILKYIYLILNKFIFFKRFFFFNFFRNLIKIDYNFLNYLSKNLIIFKYSFNYKNENWDSWNFYNCIEEINLLYKRSNVVISNVYFFDYLINIYKTKNFYKNSGTLNKASTFFNSYIKTYVT